MPVSQEDRTQDDMKDGVEDELRDATWRVQLTDKRGVISTDARTVKIVIDELRPTFDALTSGGVSTEADPRLPKSFKTEPPSYKPVTDLLNKIITTASRYISPSHLHGLRFHPFGQGVKDSYRYHATPKPLKPDGVAVIGELPIKETIGENLVTEPEFDLHWKDVEIFFESKANVRDMVRQSGTYARCCVLSNPRRSFGLGIGFQYKSMEAYVFVFHHAGLSASHPLKVTNIKGFNLLVEHIVGILSFKDATTYGLDPTRFQDLFCINDRLYRLTQFLCVRGNLRGRSTTVYSLEGMCMRILNAGLHLFIAYPADEGVAEDHANDMKSRMLELTPGVKTLPDDLTYKLTYQVEGQSQEGQLFSQFLGQFGIADVIGHYECGIEDLHGSTNRLLNETNAEFWEVFDQKGPSKGGSPKPETRRLQCIAFSGKGKALLDVKAEGGIPPPGELLEAILHAIMGE